MKRTTPKTPGAPTGIASEDPVVDPISIRALVGKGFIVEKPSSWMMIGNMCRYVFEGKKSDGRQCNPDNFLFHRKTKVISMGPREVLDHYKTEDAMGEEARNVFAIGLTIQYVLTGDETVPPLHADKIRCGISEDAWELINSMVSTKTCSTWDGIQNSKWWVTNPHDRNAKLKKETDKKAVARLSAIYEEKSKFACFVKAVVVEIIMLLI